MAPKPTPPKRSGAGQRRQKPESEEAQQQQPASEDDDSSKPWRTLQRPKGASPAQDNGFTLEDDAAVVLVENCLLSLTVSDPHQKGNPLVFVSPGFEALSGYAGVEVLGKNCKLLQVEGEEVNADQLSKLRSSLGRRSFTCVELENARKDGRTFANLLCVAPMVDAHDNLQKFVAVQCDLSDRKRWEAVDEAFVGRWQEQAKQYLGACMVLDLSAFDPSSAGTLSAVSAGFTALTGYSQADVAGHSCLCLAGPDSSSKAMKKLVLAQWACKPAAVRLLCYKKDGTPFWGYLFSCPLSCQGQSCAVRQAMCILIDVTATRLKKVGKFMLGKVVGSGAYGTVRLGKNTHTDEVVAVKMVDGSQFRSIGEIEQMQEEMNVLSSLKHPNIIRLLEVHFINNIFHLIMELASGGSLVKFIYEHEDHCLPEAEAKRLFFAMSSALDYCHRRRIIHRDLKPENILMDEHNDIKIVDFGMAAVTAPSGKNLTQQCGTPEFSAPEIATGKEYDGPSVDIWSLGVILYEALSGRLPFKGASHAALCKAIQRGTYEPLPAHISKDCKDLIKSMLTVDPASRITLDEILRHPWCHEMLGPDEQGDSLGSEEEECTTDSYGGGGEHGGSPVPCKSSASHLAEEELGGADGGSSKSDSLRLVIDGAQDDPITAAIMRAQKSLHNVDIINDQRSSEQKGGGGGGGSSRSSSSSQAQGSSGARAGAALQRKSNLRPGSSTAGSAALASHANQSPLRRRTATLNASASVPLPATSRVRAGLHTSSGGSSPAVGSSPNRARGSGTTKPGGSDKSHLSNAGGLTPRRRP